jgi:sugar phosphate isomerase/epimerase
MRDSIDAAPSVSRRHFLTSCAAAAAAGSLVTATGVSAGTPPFAGLDDANRKICFFSKDLQWLDYDQLAETVAEAGLDGIDYTVRPGGHVLPERVTDDLPRAVEAARRRGLRVHMITTAITDATHPATEPILRTASELGIRYYRFGNLEYDRERGVSASLDAFGPRLRALQAINQRFGMHGAYQNHAGARVGGPVWDLWVLFRDLDPQWMGVQYDLRHATVEGAQSWALALDLVRNHVRTMVTKDFHWVRDAEGRWRIHNVPLGEGMSDFPRFFDLVREYGITGPISLHVEYPIIERDEESLPLDARRRKAVSVLARDGRWLREMLARARLV